MADSLEADLFNDDTEEEGMLTASQILSLMQQLWLNEKLSPELLPWNGPVTGNSLEQGQVLNRSEVIECITQQVSEMEKNLERSRKKTELKTWIHRMELQRIRYLISDFYRARLKKVEANCDQLLSEHPQSTGNDSTTLGTPSTSRLDTTTGSTSTTGGHRQPTSQSLDKTWQLDSLLSGPQRMSDQELSYASEFAKLSRSHLRSVALDSMPANLQTLDSVSRGAKVNGYVFVRVVGDVSVRVGEETSEEGVEIVDMKKGEQRVIRYKDIAELIDRGDVVLI